MLLWIVFVRVREYLECCVCIVIKLRADISLTIMLNLTVLPVFAQLLGLLRLSELKQLQTLRLHHLPMVTETLCVQLLIDMPSLQLLDIRGCDMLKAKKYKPGQLGPRVLDKTEQNLQGNGQT